FMFLFRAEDGIRGFHVTGVQTCALPICVKAGAVVDPVACEQAVRQAVALAERMAKVRVESVLLPVAGGRVMGHLIEATSDIRGEIGRASCRESAWNTGGGVAVKV